MSMMGRDLFYKVCLCAIRRELRRNGRENFCKSIMNTQHQSRFLRFNREPRTTRKIQYNSMNHPYSFSIGVRGSKFIQKIASEESLRFSVRISIFVSRGSQAFVHRRLLFFVPFSCSRLKENEKRTAFFLRSFL